MNKISRLCLVLYIGINHCEVSAQVDFEKLLTNNSEISIDSNQTGVNFEIFDSSFKDKRVFFTGEDHRYIESNNNYSLAFMKYLHQKHGVRHMIIELGQTWGKLLNTYIQTGDTVIFELIKKSSYVSYQQYFKKLYEYNKDLPEDKKIIVTGIDVTRSFSISVHYMNHLIPTGKEIPEEILVNVEAIRSLSIYLVESDKKEREQNRSLFRTASYSFYNSLDSILANFNNYKNLYESYLDSNFNEYAAVMKGLEEHLVWRKYESKNMIQKFIFREQFMLKQFEKLLSQYSDDKFYGQFGRCHVGQNTLESDCDWYGIRPIATRMNEMSNESIQGKVMTLAIIYTDGMTYKKKLSETINNMINSTPKNTIYVFPYSEDIMHQDSLVEFARPSLYNYVIIDSKAKLPVSYTDSGPSYYYSSYYDDDQYTVIGSSYTFNQISLNKMNESLRTNSLFNDFTTPIESQIFFIDVNTFYKRWGYGIGFDYSHIQKQRRQADTASNVSLGGFQANMRLALMYRLGRNKTFWLSSGFQMGYAERHLSLEYVNPNIPTLQGFENFETITFKNRHMSFNPFVSVSKLFLDFLIVGVDAGYNLHSNAENWRSSGNKIIGPNQSWNGLFFGFRAALAIYSYI